MTKLEWHEEAQSIIEDRLEEFLQHFYPSSEVKSISNGSYRLNPCPVCGHNDSATVSFCVKCFSGGCDWKGSHVSAYVAYATDKKKKTVKEAYNDISSFIGIGYPFSQGDDEDELYIINKRKQEIKAYAEQFYHNKLMKSKQTYMYKGREYTPLSYMVDVRMRKEQTLTDLRWGFVEDYTALVGQLINKGYTKAEIKSAQVWAYEGLFIFFYHHPVNGDIIRFNIKNPFGIRGYEIKDGKKEYKDEPIKGMSSAGAKYPYFPPNFSFSKDVVIVEGEHDIASVYENGWTNSSALGGNVSDDILAVYKRVQGRIYTMYDNDNAGKVYTTRTNTILAEKEVYSIVYSSYSDPDEFFIHSAGRITMPSLMENAEKLKTEEVVVSRKGALWTIGNRHKKLEFKLSPQSSNDKIMGDMTFYKNGKVEEKEFNKALNHAKAAIKPLNFQLMEKINETFNNNIYEKSVEELADIYWYSSKKFDIVRAIAKKLYQSGNDEDIVQMLKRKLISADGREDIIDSILKEVNDLQNKNFIENFVEAPLIRISQYFNVKNNDAYFYFIKVQQDGNTVRKIPFLLKNDNTLVRLDLLKRKDSQCMLLVDNKYELASEVHEAIMNLDECSLWQEYVEKWLNNGYSESDIDPRTLVDQICAYVKKFYYINDESVYKMLALYIYTTYFYELLDEIPYIYLNGEKGSGKSVLGAVFYLLCFNAKMTASITEASLFRMVSLEGGTVILDEMENLTSRKQSSDSPMAAILKAGYARGANTYRVNRDQGDRVEKFDCYGPKIIGNIFGLDDVIADRCIPINTYRLKLTKENRREDPKYYRKEKLPEVRELTSKCCFSALKYFKELHKIKHSELFETDNARLSQILTPMLAVAKLVDRKEVEEMASRGMSDINSSNVIGTYEKAMRDFYESTIRGLKEDTERNTPEGIIKKAVARIAEEIWYDIDSDDREYTVPTNHKFNGEIKYSKDEGWFEVSTLHFKCFVEENTPGETAYTKYIARWIKTCYNIDHKDITRRTVTVENEDMVKEFKGNDNPIVNCYRFYFRDFIQDLGGDFSGGSIKASLDEAEREKLF